MPIDPSMLTSGGQWKIAMDEPGFKGSPDAGGASGAQGAGGAFGSMLTQQLGKLQATQDSAATASQELAAGTATDPSAAVMAVERARLSMQLASTLRTKGVEAVNDIFHTQV